jgi:hypothetical protein
MLSIRDQIELELRKIVKNYNEWLISPNVELDFQTPEELLSKQQYTKLWTLIYNTKQAISA